VYVPGKGYCPICVVETTDKDEIEVSDRGRISSEVRSAYAAAH